MTGTASSLVANSERRLMKVLIIHRYFWPDTPPYASLLRAIAERWANDGHDVTVLSSQPSYNPNAGIAKQAKRESLGKIQVLRAWLFAETKTNMIARGINLILFMARVFGHIAFQSPKYKIVMAATTPPVFVALAARIAASLRGGKFIYHCQDIYPEVLIPAGLAQKGFFYTTLRAIDSSNSRGATRSVVLSEDMAKTVLERKGVERSQVRLINNFTVPIFGDKQTAAPKVVEPVLQKFGDRFRVLFAGNLGRFQGLEHVVAAAHLLKDVPDLEFVFLGDGVMKERLIDQAGDLVPERVHFLPHCSQSDAERMVATADLSLIALSPGIIKTAFPSKTMTYLSMGSPLLVITETDSELAEMTITNRLGYVANTSDPESIASCVHEAIDNRDQISAMRDRAKDYCQKNFSAEACLGKWSELLTELEQGCESA